MELPRDVRRSAPVLLQAARWLQSRRVRGSDRLEGLARARGWLDVVVRYPLGRRAAIDVPLRRRPYDHADVLTYERSAVSLISEQLRGQERPVVLVDCGADIGLISARLVAACPQIRRVIALEPNAESYRTLADNTALLEVDASAKHAAVADFVGRGELAYPSPSADDHAAYLVPRADGDVEVTTIDALQIPSDAAIAIKADVEGGETAALRGAEKTLARAPWFLVSFEAHRLQAMRAGIDILDIIKGLLDLRPCDVYAVRSRAAHVAEQPANVRLDRPFFEQFENDVYNVVCVAR